MAANDYYGSFNNRREDAPLPPVPASPSPQQDKPPHIDVSPVHSPFDDHSYPTYPQASQQSLPSLDTSYHGPHRTGGDPFSDQNAIPLQSQPAKMESPPQYSDPEAFPSRPHRKRRSRRQKDGWFTGKIPWVVYVLTLVQIGVFIGELVKNATLTGSPIMLKPYFNIMIGPSPYVQINMGARYVPCMHNVDNLQNNPDFPLSQIGFPCPNNTDSSNTECSLSQLCGFNGVPIPDKQVSLDHNPQPNQWWRFITPIFMHAGIIHITFNMLLQLTLGRDVERQIGSIRFFLLYFSCGIFGFVLGGNYAATGIASTGASGALFGLIAIHLLDLLYTWKTRKSPVRDLLFILLDVAIAFVLGLLPGLDNFSHIGGFLMGCVLGICILHSPDALRERIGQSSIPYGPVASGGRSGRPESPESAGGLEGVGKGGVVAFAKQPLGFFKGRKPLWWAWWAVRVACLLAILIGFIELLRNFYEYHNTCSWCKYLSCLPVSNWCDVGYISLTSSNDTSSNNRMMFMA